MNNTAKSLHDQCPFCESKRRLIIRQRAYCGGCGSDGAMMDDRRRKLAAERKLHTGYYGNRRSSYRVVRGLGLVGDDR